MTFDQIQVGSRITLNRSKALVKAERTATFADGTTERALTVWMQGRGDCTLYPSGALWTKSANLLCGACRIECAGHIVSLLS